MGLGDVEKTYKIVLKGKDDTSRALHSASHSADNASSRFTKLGATMKAVGIAAATMGAAALAAAAYIGIDLLKAGISEQESMRKLAFQLKKTTGATKEQISANEQWITQMSYSTKFADDELRPALTQLAMHTDNLSEAQRVLKVAMDVSTQSGKPLLSIAVALGKAMDGNLSSLSRYGIATKDAKGHTLSFAEVMDELKKKTHGAAEAAGKTAAGRWAELGHQFQDIKEELGMALIPLFLKFAKWAKGTLVPFVKNSLVPAFHKFTAWIKHDAVPWIKESLIPNLQKVWEWLVKHKYILDWVIKADVAWFHAMQAVWHALGNYWHALTNVWHALTNVWHALGNVWHALTNVGHAIANVDRFFLGAEQRVVGFVEALARIPDNIFGGVGNFLSHLPGFAAGGMIPHAAAGTVMVGEYGPEILTLGRGRAKVTPHSASMGRGAGGNIIINVTASPGGEKAAARATVDALRKAVRTGALPSGWATGAA